MVLSAFCVQEDRGLTSYYSPWLSWALCAMEVKVHIQVDISFFLMIRRLSVVRHPCHGLGPRDRLRGPPELSIMRHRESPGDARFEMRGSICVSGRSSQRFCLGRLTYRDGLVDGPDVSDLTGDTC